MEMYDPSILYTAITRATQWHYINLGEGIKSDGVLGHVYVIVADHRIYVGKHLGESAKDRLQEHWDDVKKGSMIPIHVAMRKSFQTFRVVYTNYFADDKELCVVEGEYIRKYNSIKDGWNVRQSDANNEI